MADKLNVLTICGSLRKGSFNRMLMNATIGLAPETIIVSSSDPTLMSAFTAAVNPVVNSIASRLT